MVNVLLFAAVVERVVYDGESLPAVSVNGIALGARSETELRAALTAIAERYETRTFAATVGTVALQTNGVELGVHVEIETVIRTARSSGRSGNPVNAILGIVLRRMRDNEIAIPITYNNAAITAVAESWKAAANINVRNADVRFDRGHPTIVPPAAANGIDAATIVAELKRVAISPSDAPVLKLLDHRINPTIGIDQARRVADRADQILARRFTITTAPKQFVLTGSRLATALVTKIQAGTLNLAINPAKLRALIDGALDSKSSPPVDATFRIANDGTVAVVPSRVGKGPDLQHISDSILAGTTAIDAPLTTSKPVHDTAWANSLGIHELVSTFTTHHPCCPPRVTNIHAAATIMNGAVIEAGETFSFNDIVGARTAERGFVKAPVYYGEFTEDFGGGVSQLATTTFNAAFWGGFAIVAHMPHTIYFDRYPQGREATVNYPVLDLKWRNDSKHGVLVHTYFSSSTITVALYGDREGKTVRETVPGCSVGPIVDTAHDPRCMHLLATIPTTDAPLKCPAKNPTDDPGNKCATLKANEMAAGALGHTGYAVEFFRTITYPGRPATVERFSWRYQMLPNVILIGAEGNPGPTTTTLPGATTTTPTGPPGAQTTTTASTATTGKPTTTT